MKDFSIWSNPILFFRSGSIFVFSALENYFTSVEHEFERMAIIVIKALESKNLWLCFKENNESMMELKGVKVKGQDISGMVDPLWTTPSYYIL